MQDLLRRGLAAVQREPPTFWEGMAARMVDAQAPGVARVLRDMPGVMVTGDGWQDRALERLAMLHLLVEGYARLESLPAEVQADVRTQIGWSQNQEELRPLPGVSDEWLVLGQRVETEDRLTVQRTWLWGRQARHGALILDFARGTAAPEQALTPGMSRLRSKSTRTTLLKCSRPKASAEKVLPTCRAPLRRSGFRPMAFRHVTS